VQERPNACNLEDLANLKAPPTVQDRPETSAESRPALHQTTTPGTLPFWLLKAAELSVLLTVKEVADRLKVSRATVYGLVRRGELRSVRVSNTIRVPRDAVEALVIWSRPVQGPSCERSGAIVTPTLATYGPRPGLHQAPHDVVEPGDCSQSGTSSPIPR
jgi:excisionase family DNA binding protein